MTKDQKDKAQTAIRVTQSMLQHIMSGQYELARDLREQRQCVDWQLCLLLCGLLPTLPQDVRAQVQACYDLREQVWSTEYMNAYHAAQKEASPSCLAASDSL